MRKSGAWYTYEGDQLGQGKENARNFLRENADLANEIEKRIKEKLGVGPRVDAEADASNGSAATATETPTDRAVGNGATRQARQPRPGPPSPSRVSRSSP